jgi:hypothetical protein
MYFGKATIIGLILMAGGCATVPYHPTSVADYPGRYPHAEKRPDVARGRPSPVLDASDWYWPPSLLGKLLLWNGNVDSHEVSEETIQAAIGFCQENDLGDVMIRVNAYSVADEWRRTFGNDNVGPIWRYPLGFLAWLQYTALPGRFFGGDNYNPYSNTINLYSDLKPIALHEAGHAQDFASRRDKGLYAFLYMVPFVNLYHEAVASSTALSYIQTTKPVKQQKEAYRLLYPAYATYLGGNLGEYVFTAAYYPVYLGSVAIGHVAGILRAASLSEEPARQKRPEDRMSWDKSEDGIPPQTSRAYSEASILRER